MAALLDDRELHSFKLFAGRRRAEYALRFPFLTERQISAKLRRVWQSRKGERIGISTGRKRDQAIQTPHAGGLMPTATSGCRERMCPKGDLSAFDVDSDTSPPSFHLPPPPADHNTTTAPKTNCSLEKPVNNASIANQPRVIEGRPTSSGDYVTLSDGEVEDPFCEKPREHSEEVGRGEGLGTSPQCRPSIAAAPQSQPRTPLQSLDNSPAKPITNPPAKSREKPFVKSPAANLYDTTQVLPPSPHHKPPSVGEMCTVPQNEARRFPTNNLPFSRGEAQRGAGDVSEGRLKTHQPIMAGVAVGSPSKPVPLENTALCHPRPPDMAPLLSPDTKKAVDFTRCPSRKTPDITAVLRGATRSSQSSGTPGETPQFASLYTSSVIHSMPSPAPAPPSPAAFLQIGAALALRPPASSPDGINGCSVFQSGAMNTAATQFPANRSSAGQKCEFPDTLHFSPVSGTTTYTGNNSTCSRSGAVVPRADGIRRMVKRCRSRRRESFPSFCLAGNLSSSTHGGKEVRDSVENAPLYESFTQMERENSGPVADLEKGNGFSSDKRRKVFSLTESGVEEPSDTVNHDEASLLTTSPAATKHTLPPHQEQTVPEEEPPLTPCTSPQPHQKTPSQPALPPVATQDLMCDMFQLITPDRPNSGSGSRQHSRDVSHDRQTSKRRVFRSASTEGSSNFYSMFVDDSDIFM